MSIAVTPALEGLSAPGPRATRPRLLRRLVSTPVGLLSTLYLIALLLLGAFADQVAPNDPDAASATNILSPPGDPFLLGGDGSGHDIWSRLVHAIPRTLEAGALAVAVATVLGVTAGLISGYYGRWFRTVSLWTASTLMALPGIVVLLCVRAVVGPSMFAAMAVFGVLMSPAMYYVVHTSVASAREELYIDAAKVAGLSDGRIVFRHILAVVRAPALIMASMLSGISIAIQSGLDFLGLGDLSHPTWGGILKDAFDNIYSAPRNLWWPSLAIGLTCMALVLLASALGDALSRRDAAPSRRRRRAAASTVAPPSAGEAREARVVHPDLATPRGEVLLDISGLRVGYDQSDGTATIVVEDSTLTVRRGEVHGLIGESGSGKTQTAFAVMRLLPGTGRIMEGSVRFEGEDLARCSIAQMVKLRGARIAYIPQEPMSNLDPSFTIGAQLVEPIRYKLGLSRGAAKQKALGLLERVGIAEPQRVFDSYPHQVSGGMAQRILIAGAVSCEPDLLIADEPTTALDVTVQAEVLDLLRELTAEIDMGVLLVTHNFGVVADLCDHVSVMRAGRIVETGPTESVFDDPQHEYTRGLFQAILDEADPREPWAAPQSGGGDGSAVGAGTASVKEGSP